MKLMKQGRKESRVRKKYLKKSIKYLVVSVWNEKDLSSIANHYNEINSPGHWVYVPIIKELIEIILIIACLGLSYYNSILSGLIILQ